LAPWHGLVLLVCPPILIGAEELRKQFLRNRRPVSIKRQGKVKNAI
jgi:hypothetical protein